MTSLIKEVKCAKMATGGSDSVSDELIQIKCCVCLEQNRTREADKFCVECKDYFCSPCIGMHKIFPMMKGHKILNKADFRTLGRNGSLPSFPTQRCPMHIEEVVKLYCKDHDEVECASCIALNHRSCKNVVSIPEDIDNLYKNVSLNNVKSKFSATKKRLEEIKKIKENKLQEIKGMLNHKIETVKAFRKELQELLDKYEQDTINELRIEFYRTETSLTKDINAVKMQVIHLNDAASQLKKFEGNKAQVFVCVKLFHKLLAKGVKLETSQQMTTDETICFIPDQCIKTFLQQNNSLGKVSVVTTKGKVSIGKAEGPIYTPKEGLYRVKQQREIEVKLQNDSDNSFIYGSCITEDGSLLLADYYNSRLKCVDMSTDTIKAYIDLPSRPWTVCSISKNEAAVTLDGRSVQFVSLGDKMKTTQTLKFKHRCHGVAHKDGKLFITDDGSTVYIYDMNGQEQGRIIPRDDSGKKIFKENQHIAITAIGNRMFVTDRFIGVVVLDNQGNYLSAMSDINVSGYWGVCTDGRNVFVSGWDSGNIVQYGHDFKFLGEIGKVQGTVSLCFDHQRKRLIATSTCKEKITALELE